MSLNSLESAFQLTYHHVDGWLGDRMVQIVKFIDVMQARHGVRGDITEIGIHHGKFFFLLASLARPDEACIAIDLFDDQGKNIDHSGCGSRATFEAHAANLFPELEPQIRILAMDSMAITPAIARQVVSAKGVRVFSIDGGHTVRHVLNDMAIAEELLVSSGIVLLDDFLGPHWPSVSEGFFTYMSRTSRRLAPFLIFQNKLFLTTYSEHEQVLREVRAFLDDELGAEIHSGHWRYTEMCGFRILCFA